MDEPRIPPSGRWPIVVGAVLGFLAAAAVVYSPLVAPLAAKTAVVVGPGGRRVLPPGLWKLAVVTGLVGALMGALAGVVVRALRAGFAEDPDRDLPPRS